MLKTVGVIGAGAMGSGIAQVVAMAGYKVVLVDFNQEALQNAKNNVSISLGKYLEKGKITPQEMNAIFGNIGFDTQLLSMVDCDLVLEAIIEDETAKKTLLTQLNELLSDQCIVATNTSSLSVTALARAYKNPSRMLGLHFFNPAVLMQLVEIIPALQTDVEVIKTCTHFIEKIGKTGVVAKDTPGFIVNKVARPFYGEAIRLWEEGVADMAVIDKAMTTLGGFKMGPFALMDFIGHDINFKVTCQVWESFHFDGRYKPSFSQQRLVDAGYFGKKTGKGFYDYNAILPEVDLEENEAVMAYVFKRILCLLINEAADTVFRNICSEEDVELAMLYGTNYPKGLLSWAQEIGLDEVIYTLDGLYDRYHEERYRVSPYLRDRVALL